jgi:thioredoxin-dependent peroxiredoxin
VTGQTLNFPLIGDPDRRISNAYDMIHPNAGDTATVRSVFIIGPDNKLKLTLTYPASTGRNFLELLRVIDSLQLTAKHSVGDAGRLEERRRCDHRAGGVGRVDRTNELYSDHAILRDGSA